MGEEVKEEVNLVDINNQLRGQCQALYQENQQLKHQIAANGSIVRMEFLFQILDKATYFDPAFIETVAEEIAESMYPTPKQEEETPEVESNIE